MSCASPASPRDRPGTPEQRRAADLQVVKERLGHAPHLIENAELPSRLGRGDPRRIPAILLARLALAEELRGSGLGGVLVHDALTRAVAASQQVGGRYVVVDAIGDEAGRFCQHFGFTATPRSARLVRKVSDIEADIKT